MSLAGRTVLITGAGQGIGFGVAKLAADLGANLILADMNTEGLETARREFAEDRILTAVGDVADPEFVDTLVEQGAARFGVVDGLVNTAGITRPAMIDKMTLALGTGSARPSDGYVPVHASCRSAFDRAPQGRGKNGGRHCQHIVGRGPIGNDRTDQLQRRQGWCPGREHERCARVGALWRSSEHSVIRAGRDADDGDDPR
jgi:hypothetical protein